MALIPKMAILLIKTVTKPVAKSIKQRATEFPRFRTFCIATGNVFNRVSWRVNIMLSGHQPKEVGARLRRGRATAALTRAADAD